MTPFIVAAAALAAVFSAVTAFFAFRTQRQSVRNSVRPDVEIEDITWSDLGQTAHLEIKKVVNYGLGPARFITARIYAEYVADGREHFVSATPIATLRPGLDIQVNWVVQVPWQSPEKITKFYAK